MRALLAFGLVFGLAGLATAQEKKDDKKKADPTGTWKWTVERMGNKVEQTLKLKMDGEKLTGALIGRNNMETKIEDATMKDGEITFSTSRMMGNNKIVSKYKLKLDGDSLKGTSETEVNGQTRKVEIDAKREKEEKKDK
jgi:hypothetical protein